jgi:hypothetical protein
VLACGHDSGYAPFLGQFVGDKQAAERITLLEGSPFPAVIRDLSLKRTRFDSVFNTIAQPVAPGNLLRAPPRRGTPSTMTTTLSSHGDGSGSPIKGVPATKGSPLIKYHNALALSDRLGPVIKDQEGRRIDRPLQVDPEVMEELRTQDLCYRLFLRGKCALGKCQRCHVHQPLTSDEFDALWALARQCQCHKSRGARKLSGECADVKCVYGHKSQEA